MDELKGITCHHKEHLDWLNQLNYFQDEIKIFQNNLLVVLQQHADRLSIIEHLDEYRRILLRKLESIDTLRHQIILQEKQMVSDLKLSADLVWDHQELRLRMKDFENDFNVMKDNLRRFTAYND